LPHLYRPQCIVFLSYLYMIRYGRFTCAQKLTRWPA